MDMLYIIGIGLKPSQISMEAAEKARNCAAVFLETYTSRYAEGSAKEIAGIIDRKVVPLKREQVEKPEQLIAQAVKENVALLVHGNPLTATTHIQLLIEAKKEGVKTTVIPGISIADYLGKTGLNSYRFGRITTIVTHSERYEPESFYDMITANRENNLHTLCLLDIREDGTLMTVNEALAVLERIEKKRPENTVKDSVIIAICGAGSEKEVIKAGSFNEIRRSGYDAYPQSLVVCAGLSDKEKEALSVLYGWKGE
jgi:diphthine synthase